MRLLLDESVPVRLRLHIEGHAVQTVAEMGWLGVKNGRLLDLAASHFDAFVTVDKNLQYQQNLTKLPVSVIVLDAHSNELHVLLQLLPTLQSTLRDLAPRTLIRIEA